MSILPHTITGAVVGSFLPHPAAAFLGGVASHLVLDFIPHYDPDLSGKTKPSKRRKLYYTSVIALDFFCAFVVLFFLLPFPNLFFGGLGGMLPDIDGLLQFKFPRWTPILSRVGIPVHSRDGSWMHNKLKFSHAINFLIGVSMQSVICLGGLHYLFNSIFVKILHLV